MKLISAAEPDSLVGSDGPMRLPSIRTRVRQSAQSAQIDVRGAVGAEGRGGVALVGGDRRQIVQQNGDVRGALLLDRFVIDRGDRAVAGEVRRLDVRTGNGDLLNFTRLLLGLRVARRNHRQGDGRQSHTLQSTSSDRSRALRFPNKIRHSVPLESPLDARSITSVPTEVDRSSASTFRSIRDAGFFHSPQS